MDPLSISVSIIAIIGAMKSTINMAKSVYNVPEELESLLNNLTESEIMILDVKHHLGQPRPEYLPELNLQKRLGEAECVLLELRNLVQAILAKSLDSTSTRRYTWVKAKTKIWKLRNKLAQIHEELPRRLGQIEGSRIKLELANLSLVQEQIHTGLSRVETIGGATSQCVSNILEAQGQHTEALHLLQQLQQRVNSSIEEIRGGTLHRLDRIESAVSMIGTPRTASRIPELSIPGEQQLSNSLEPTFPHISSQTLHPTTDLNASSLRLTYYSLIAQTQYQSPNACPLACCCRCHTKQTMRTPSFLNGLIGQMFVGYKGMPTIAELCTQTNCKRTSSPSIYVTYSFPSWWILNRMILIIARRRVDLGPELILRFPSYIHPSSEVAVLIQQGKIDALKNCFANGKASPNDIVSGWCSRPLLYFALSFKNFQALKFLVQAGADLDVEDSSGRTISEIVCCGLFTGLVPEEYQPWVIETFISSSQVQSLKFPRVHEALLGFRANAHEEILRLYSAGSTIDIQDSFGYTPLNWACVRGNIAAVLQLLKFGADPNIPSNTKQPPLNRALQFGHLECAFALLDYKANACYITENGWTAFQTTIAFCTRSSSTIDLFDKLYDLGANIDAKDPAGITCVLHAVDQNYHLVLRWFLSHGADYRVLVNNTTILHFIGRCADLRTINIIREFQLSGINIDAKEGSGGRTAMDEILNPDRIPVASDKLIASFARLLSEIEARTNGMATGV